MLVSEIIKDLSSDFIEFHHYMNSFGILIYSDNQEINIKASSINYIQFHIADIHSCNDLIQNVKTYLSSNNLNRNDILSKNKLSFKKAFTSIGRLSIITDSYLYELEDISYTDITNPVSFLILKNNLSDLITKSTKFNSLYVVKKIKLLSNKVLEIQNQIDSIIKKEYKHLNSNENDKLKTFISLDFYANSDIITINYPENRRLVGNIDSVMELIRLKSTLQETKNEKLKLEIESTEIFKKINKLYDKALLIEKNKNYVFTDFDIDICKLTENDHLRFSPIKLIKLQINYKSFLEYLKDLGFTIAFYDVDCFKGNNKTDIISKCIFRWELSINSINKVCIESLVNLSNIEDTNSYENLINLCISHLEFINKLKFIRSSNYLKNNPIEQIFNKYSNKLINQIQLYKFSVHIKNIVFNEEEINKLNEIQLKLEKRAWFKVPKYDYEFLL